MNTVILAAVSVLILCLGSFICAEPAVPAIIPRPVSISSQEQLLAITADTPIVSLDNALREQAELLSDGIFSITGLRLPITDNPAEPNGIRLALDKGLTALGSEGYRLAVTATAVDIVACKPAGIFYGSQSLYQLLLKAGAKIWHIPCVEIEDYPRFTWRGMHLDVCRHYMPPEFVKKYIDLLAMHKMNMFHWHLTDDQGWRIEIKGHPKLTEIGAWRDQTQVGHNSGPEKKYDGIRHGGFYTQEQIRDIVAYAKRRHVTIVPEIEMPGHCQAAITAYPNLGCTNNPVSVMCGWGVSENIYNVNEDTFAFLEAVLSEVMALFDSPFIHIGGDEVPKTQWLQNSSIQAKIKALGLKDEKELQRWFIGRIGFFLTEHNRQLVGWDEILEGGLSPGAVVMSWRGEAGGIAAARAGHNVVMAPGSHTYFDHYQAIPANEPLAIGGFTSLEKVYHYEPVPAVLTEEQAKHILGAQGQIWTEYIATPEQVEYMAYPRAIALAEALWTPAKTRNFADFVRRLQVHIGHLDWLHVHYCPLEKAGLYQPHIRRDKGGRLSITTDMPDTKTYYTLDGSEPTIQSALYTGAIDLPGSGIVRAILFKDTVLGHSGPVVFGPCKKNWTVFFVSSEEANEAAANALDDDPETFWRTEYLQNSPSHPHTLDIDLGRIIHLRGATYTPRPGGGNGTIKECEFYTSPDGKLWSLAGRGVFDDIKRNLVEHQVMFGKTAAARYLRFVSIREINGNPWAAAAEFGIIQEEPRPPGE